MKGLQDLLTKEQGFLQKQGGLVTHPSIPIDKVLMVIRLPVRLQRPVGSGRSLLSTAEEATILIRKGTNGAQAVLVPNEDDYRSSGGRMGPYESTNYNRLSRALDAMREPAQSRFGWDEHTEADIGQRGVTCFINEGAPEHASDLIDKVLSQLKRGTLFGAKIKASSGEPKG